MWLLAGSASVVWLILIAWAYSGTAYTFLRAESGWYELIANQNSSTRAGFLHILFTRSYGGHYIPLALLCEFQLTRWIGPVEGFWHWRQIIALSLVATALFTLVNAVARIHRVRWIYGVPAAVGITSVFIFQPLMRELLSWPFMVMQLGWMACTLLALTSLVQLAAEPHRERWLWLAIAFGYGSMHLLGLGLVTALAVWGIVALLVTASYANKLLQFDHLRRRMVLALALLTVFSVAHALCMSLLLQPDEGASASLSPQFSLVGQFGFLASFFIAVLRVIVQPGAESSTVSESITALAPCGLLLATGVAILLARVIARAYSQPTPHRLANAILHLFSATLFFGVVLLMAVRSSRDPAVSSVAGFLSGSRYLVPASFAFAGSLTAILVPMLRRARYLGAVLFLFITLEALATQRYSVPPVFRKQHPMSTISHAQAWAAIVAMATECRAAKLPIPNVPLRPLVQEFSTWDLKLFEPVLRSQMHLPESEQLEFAPWATVCASPAEYGQAVPSLVQVIAELKLPIPSSIQD